MLKICINISIAYLYRKKKLMALRNSAGFNRPEMVISRSRSKINKSGNLYSFPTHQSPHAMLMIFKEYSYNAARAGQLNLLDSSSGVFNTRLEAIELPIPANLTDNDSIRVAGIEQGPLESALGELIAGGSNSLQGSNATISALPQVFQNAGKELANMDLNNFSGPLNNILSNLLKTSVSDASRDALYLLRSQLPTGVSQVADRALGSTVNPRASLAFEGVDLKTHSFEWTLSPTNKTDSDILKAIVETLKRNSLPTYQSFAGLDNFKAYLKYPSIVDVYLLGVNPEYFMKFKSCMISSITTNYSASGLTSILKGGKPAVVNLGIQLSELDIHTAEDYGAVGGTIYDSNADGATRSGSSGDGLRG